MLREITIPANYEYIESYMPPRCRKPRKRIVRGEHLVTIRCVDMADAPIAFTHRQCSFPNIARYRWYDGNLYKRSLRHFGSGERAWTAMPYFKCLFKRDFFSAYERKSSVAECLAANAERASEYLIIGGQPWHKCGEPRYVIATFGLGHNNSSTALMISDGYNHNIPWTRYFSAGKRAAAVQEALRIATARGDTNSLAGIRRSWSIKVLIPEALQCNPAAWGGEGESFSNMLEHITEISSSPSDAALMAIAAAFMH